MALIKVKPTSPGRRAVVKVVNPDLYKGGRMTRCSSARSKTAGRNNTGQITTRHMGGGHKQHYRKIDFKRDKDGDRRQGRAHRARPEPQREYRARCATRTASAVTSSRRKGLAVGTQVQNGSDAPIKTGNTMPLRNIPVGTTIHCIEMMPGKGAQIARAAGAAVQLLAREGEYAQLRLRSGEIRKVHVNCRATIGEVGNEENSLRSIGKAGARALARHTPDGARRRDEPDRPSARRRRRQDRRGPPPGQSLGHADQGLRTRKNKRTDSMIVRRRHAKVSAG